MVVVVDKKLERAEHRLNYHYIIWSKFIFVIL